MIRLFCQWKYVTILTLYFLINSISGSESSMPFLASKARYQKAILPIYSTNSLQPIAVLRLDKIFTENRRKGFFRIGLMPVRVIEGLQIELTDPERIRDSLIQVHKSMDPTAFNRAAEIRGLCIATSYAGDYKSTGTNLLHRQTTGASHSFRLEATGAKPMGDGCWELTGGVTLSTPTNQIKGAVARMQLTGNQCGKLLFYDRTVITHQIFLWPPD